MDIRILANNRQLADIFCLALACGPTWAFGPTIGLHNWSLQCYRLINELVAQPNAYLKTIKPFFFQSFLVPKSYGPKVLWSQSHMDPKSYGPKVPLTQTPMVWNIPLTHCPKVPSLISHIVSESYGSKVTWSKEAGPKVLVPKSIWSQRCMVLKVLRKYKALFYEFAMGENLVLILMFGYFNNKKINLWRQGKSI